MIDRYNNENIRARYIKPEENKCKLDYFFKQQKELHPNMRSVGAMLVCDCLKCRLSKGTL